MKELVKQMKSILKTFDMLDNRDMTINVYTNTDHDVHGLVHFAYVHYIGNGLKNKYKAKFKSKYHSFDNTADLNIEFSSYESNEDKIMIDKTKMLSHRLLKVVFYVNDWEKVHDVYNIFIKWGANRQKPIKYEDNEMTMTVPPDDPSDPNYKQYMKQWFKFCEETPEWIQKLKEDGVI